MMRNIDIHIYIIGVRIILALCLFTFSPLLYAQLKGESEYRLDDAKQLWRHTDNAAGLGLDSTRNRGFALFNAEHQEGDYARVQEGDMTNQLRFKTERYQAIGKYLQGYGSFDFDYGRTKNRAWCDVRRPYNSNPFIAGSAIRGKYDFQDFNFTGALGTVSFNGWRFGAKLQYNVGDLSRLRDPRSRSELLDYKISPAITHTWNKHTIGLSGNYHRRKEKITGLTTVQQDPTLKYYLMSGMEHANGTIGGYSSFSREWVDHRFGAELSYAYYSEIIKSLLNATIERGEENAFGQYKYEPGRYVDYHYQLNWRNRFNKGNLLHEVDAEVRYDQAFADEYRQQLEIEREAETGYTSYRYHTQITFKKRYQVKLFHSQIRYRCSFIGGNAINAYFGANITMNDTKNKHLLPLSDLHYDGFDFSIEGGKQFIHHRLWVDATATYHLKGKSKLSLNDETTDYAVNVLIPDMKYYQANYWKGHIQLTYQFPLHIKGKQSMWFVRAYGDYLKTNNSLDASCIGMSIGLFN